MTRKPSPAEPVTELRKVRIVDNGEPLVDFRQAVPELVMAAPRFDYQRETLVRKSVADMLRVAAGRVPRGYQLGIIEGWRPPTIQRRMYRAVRERFRERHPDWSDTKLTRFINQFTAPMNSRVPPPHTTGGAVDLTLHDESGNELDMMAPFERVDTRAFNLDTPGLSESSRKHRQILREALEGTGLTNYPSEYWHWSYGDQGWAYRGGHPHALYAAIEPEGYVAPENADEPLEMLI